ncbi:N-acetylglucosamine-6-phosphate deacetylase [Cohnella cellulosilytica]|uniref:N-acetylglucosamine-6-phosphate deacetylase n=1 Tax=Cohnella cellulosilytica TaxID=986710 RepID=A0ABW2FFW2_9BACL
MAAEKTLYRNCTLYTGTRVIRGGSLLVDGAGVVVDAGGGQTVSVPADARVVDLKGRLVLPGFVDVHVHGGGGWDMLRGTPEDFAGAARYHAAHGTTSLLATTGGAPEADTSELLRHARRAIEERNTGGADVIGVHLEGPFLHPARKGAFREEWLHPPDFGEMDRYLDTSGGTIRIVTLAPELEGGEAFVRRLCALGIRVSVGHSDASYEQMLDAVEWGARRTTHHFNGMRPLHHRDPGAAGAGLMLPALTTELIADGLHVHPAAIRFLFDVKGVCSVCVITDAVAQAGLPDGVYGSVETSGGEIYLSGTRTLAGSSSTMLGSLRRVLSYTGRTLENVLPSFTAVPAREAGAASRKGTLEAGKDADFLVLDESLELLETYVRGRRVYVGAGAAYEDERGGDGSC